MCLNMCTFQPSDNIGGHEVNDDGISKILML